MCVIGLTSALWIFGHSWVCFLEYSAQLRLETDWSNYFRVAIKVAFRTDIFSPPSTGFKCKTATDCTNAGTCDAISGACTCTDGIDNSDDCSGGYYYFDFERLLISWFNHCPGQTQCVKRLRKMSEITHFQLDHKARFQWCSFLISFDWNGMLFYNVLFDCTQFWATGQPKNVCRWISHSFLNLWTLLGLLSVVLSTIEIWNRSKQFLPCCNQGCLYNW